MINAGESVEKRELSYAAGGNIYWFNHYAEQYGVSFYFLFYLFIF